MKELGRARIYNVGNDEDGLVEAYAPVTGQRDQYRKIGFKRGMIDYVFEIDEAISGITLSNGVTIPVALAYAELKRRLYDPCGGDCAPDGTLDLCDVSGKAVGDVQAVRLAKDFNPAAEDSAPAASGTKKTAELNAYVHLKSEDRQFRLIKFAEEDIDYFEPHAGRKDSETFVRLKNPIEGCKEFFVPVPITSFTYYLNSARERTGTYDLAEATRPKKTTDLKM